MAWNELGRKARRAVADIFEIPGEVALDLPRIVLVGNVQVFIENHRGIVEYTTEVVRVIVPSGEVAVRGRELTLRNIERDEIAVEGTIESLSFT